MSRFKRFAHSLASGYVLLGANMLYTLASVPLALYYLSFKEFALWALVTQTASYVALVDFGLSASASRVLIDHKDNRASGQYGSMVQTGALVGLTQGLLVMIFGSVVALFLGPALKVDAELLHKFTWLMLGQCGLVGLGFATRILNHMLTAHQRYDITNYTQSILFGTSFTVMWICMARGMGVFSVLVAQASGTLIVVAANFWGCARLQFLPHRGEWGRPSWSAFKELFSFGRDFFFFTLGNQLINASQVLLLTRFCGLEAAAVWSICTRLYLVFYQSICRIFDYSSGALAEMMVRGERVLLQRRFRDIVVLSSSFSVAVAIMLAACNTAFVSWWTSGRINSVQFFPADIKEPAALVQKLTGGLDPVSKFLWEQFPASTKAEIEPGSPTQAEEDKLKRLLADEFNLVLNAGVLNDPQRFSQADVSTETKSLLARRRTPAESQRLNRYLLEDAYPRELANSRRATWSPLNDVLLGIWLIISVAINAHTGLVGQTKVFAFMRFLLFIEGSVFIALAVLAFRFGGGMTLMLLISIACSAMFRLPYGLYRTRKYFGIPAVELAGWHQTIPRLLLVLAPVALLVWWLTRNLPSLVAFSLTGGICALAAGLAVLRWGFSPSLKAEIFRRVPAWGKPCFRRLGFTDATSPESREHHAGNTP